MHSLTSKKELKNIIQKKSKEFGFDIMRVTDPKINKEDNIYMKEFLDKKILPAYAHSWMLTSVVSADYVDVTGNGVTSDDLGYWVDFKYEKTTDSYNWRAPYKLSLIHI